jgi:hypothetical protein
MRSPMAILANQTGTLTSGQTSVLHAGRFQKFRVTITGISGEFTTIPFQTLKNGRIESKFFEATTVLLRVYETVLRGEIRATTPAGVATLDIVFELRTGNDA